MSAVPGGEPLSRFQLQSLFVQEADQLKGIVRRNYICDGGRLENTAEHSWHLALMVMTLAEHANQPIDIFKTIQMLLIHDLVEIDAGDTYCHDPVANQDKVEREEKAAGRIFGLLPEEQGLTYYQLWQEFEARETPESRFANAVDRFLPLTQNMASGGIAWRHNRVSKAQVMVRCRPIEDGSVTLWHQAESIIDKAVAKGYLVT